VFQVNDEHRQLSGAHFQHHVIVEGFFRNSTGPKHPSYGQGVVTNDKQQLGRVRECHAHKPDVHDHPQEFQKVVGNGLAIYGGSGLLWYPDPPGIYLPLQSASKTYLVQLSAIKPMGKKAGNCHHKQIGIGLCQHSHKNDNTVCFQQLCCLELISYE
jgi:hypothetical protein